MLSKAKEFPDMICNELDRATPLHFAIVSGNLENAKILLRNGANVNSKDANDNTPMHFAVSSNNLRTVRLLDEYGASATSVNVDEICAIDIALTEDFKDIKMHFLGQSKYADFDFTGMR